MDSGIENTFLYSVFLYDVSTVHHFELLKRKNSENVETASTETKATKVSKIDHFVQIILFLLYLQE